MIPSKLNQSNAIASIMPVKDCPKRTEPRASARAVFMFPMASSRFETAQSAWPSRSYRVVVIVMILVLLNALDLEFTLLALTHGLLFEANPIASYLLSTPAQFIIYKVTLAALGVSMLLASRRTTMGEITALLICSFYVILIYQWIACFSLFQAAYYGDSLF